MCEGTSLAATRLATSLHAANRPGRTRTCSPRFWSPLLATPVLHRLLIFNDLAPGQQRRRCWTTPALALSLALRRVGLQGDAPSDLASTTMIWLGNRRGYLADWITQRWVQFTGRRVRFSNLPWLDGPVGDTRGIGRTFFETYATRHGLRAVRSSTPRGLRLHFRELAGPHFDPGQGHPAVARLYEETSEYTLDAWSQWCGAFRPFGSLLALLFSRRLQQPNLPF